MACVTALSNYDQIMYLCDFKDEHYPLLKLNSKNKIDFENRCYEIDMCDRVIATMFDDILEDPENVLWEYRLFLEYEMKHFKHNTKRILMIEKLINVLDNLEITLKVFKGEQIWK